MFLTVIISIVIGIVSVIAARIAVIYMVNRKLPNEPRFIKMSHRIVALINYNRTRIFTHWKFKDNIVFDNWDMGKGYWRTTVDSGYIGDPLPLRIGDAILVQGKYNQIFILVVIYVNSNRFETAYVGRNA
jgi:hypothetical protein